MSQWTGELYGFYTNKPINSVFNKLKIEAKKIGYQYEYHTYGDEEALLFFKDKEMLRHHFDKGYHTNLKGEGCFCVEAKIVNLHGISSLFEYEQHSDFEPYDINLMFDGICYYVLIVPEFIEESKFSFAIHEMFTNIIKEVDVLSL